MAGRETLRHQARVLQIRDPDREVEPFGHDVDELVGQRQVERDLGIGREEIDEMRRDMHAAERRRRADPEKPARGGRAS